MLCCYLIRAAPRHQPQSAGRAGSKMERVKANLYELLHTHTDTYPIHKPHTHTHFKMNFKKKILGLGHREAGTLVLLLPW